MPEKNTPREFKSIPLTFSPFHVENPPIFSLDGNYCVVKIGTQCDWLAGGGGIRLYRKTNAGWTFVEEYVTWVS